jgi:hypothetical protein
VVGRQQRLAAGCIATESAVHAVGHPRPCAAVHPPWRQVGAEQASIEAREPDLGLIYRAMGRKGLERIENVGPKMAEVVEGLIQLLPGEEETSLGWSQIA